MSHIQEKTYMDLNKGKEVRHNTDDIKSDNCCVLVKNLPNRFDLERTLCDFFIKTCGKIAGIRLEDDGEQFAKATIRFEDPKSAQEALHQTCFQGREITVKMSKCQHSESEQWSLFNQQQQILGLGQQHDLVGQSALESFKQWNGIGVKGHHENEPTHGGFHHKMDIEEKPHDKRRFGVRKGDSMKRYKEMDSHEPEKKDSGMNEKFGSHFGENDSLKKSGGFDKMGREDGMNQKFQSNFGEKHMPSGYGQNSSGLGPNGGLGIDCQNDKDWKNKRDILSDTHDKTDILKPSVDQLQHKIHDLGISDTHAGIKGEYGKQDPVLREKELYGLTNNDKDSYNYDRKEHMRSGLTRDEKRDVDKYQTMQDKSNKESFGEKITDMKENLREKASKVTDKILH